MKKAKWRTVYIMTPLVCLQGGHIFYIKNISERVSKIIFEEEQWGSGVGGMLSFMEYNSIHFCYNQEIF